MKRIKWSETHSCVLWDCGCNTPCWSDTLEQFTTDYRGSEWADIADMTWNPETGVTHITVKEPVREKTLLEAAEAYLEKYRKDSLGIYRRGNEKNCDTVFVELMKAIERERAKPANPYTKEAVKAPCWIRHNGGSLFEFGSDPDAPTCYGYIPESVIRCEKIGEWRRIKEIKPGYGVFEIACEP